MVTSTAFMRDYMNTVANPMKIVRHNASFVKKVVAGHRAFQLAQERNLVPTPYFFEALDYARKAKTLQAASLIGRRVPKVGDPLMEAIPIYNTVQRRYAGFSNVPEQLWYANVAPKLLDNLERGFWRRGPESWKTRVKNGQLEEWLFICLAHRLTGSGASFEWDHGWRNNHIVEMQQRVGSGMMGLWLASQDRPIFTSIGNQIPPFNKPTGRWKSGGRQYLAETAPELVMMVTAALMTWKAVRSDPMPIKECVDMVLRFQRALGHRQFKFVLTAWVMDMAEYLPEYVDPKSDCYHGKNAIESMNICFTRQPGMKLQDFYDTATRLFADVTGTNPMDVEDASPGCDLVRWIENYVPKKGFDHVHEKGIFNGSSLTWHAGRQP